MKHLFCLLLTFIILISLVACKTNSDNTDKTENIVDDITTSCSKELVDEFMSIISETELDGLSAGMKLDAEHCYNVTPLSVAEQTDIKIFKFSDSCVSLALIDGKVYSVCESFGGFGFVNALPFDYDEDGNLDLLIASSWGSGLHRSIISIFNTATKESIVIYDTSSTVDPCVDLIVSVASSEDDQGPAPCYQVCTADIDTNNNNFADLSYVTTGVIGSVIVKNSVPVFEPINN